jgi:peroxiredoxin
MPRRTGPLRHVVPWLGLVLLLAGCGEQAPRLQAGDPAPAFGAERLDGSTLSFPGDYRGRVVALRFWADWCPYCKEEMQSIEPVYGRQRAAGLAVLAVNVGQSRGVAERFVRELGISYEAALDPETRVANLYGVIGLPLTYFIDRQGRVRNKILGEASTEVFERMASQLLQEPVP